MADRDRYGNYTNNKGVTIKINTDRNGNDHVSFYKGAVDKSHDAAHVNINYDKSSWSSTTHGPDKSDTKSGSGGCYLTSACMRHMQERFDDNCEELIILRWFRDKFVSEEDIKHYYEIAPIIVEVIDRLGDNDSIYNYIYNDVVIACVIAIKNGDYDFAYNVYKNSILTLEEQFAKPQLTDRLIKSLKLRTRTL